MTHRWGRVCVLAGACLMFAGAAYLLVRAAWPPEAQAANPPPPAAPAKPDMPADEKTIRASADDFTNAFNAGDAKAIGALWANDAEYTDETGQTFLGRSAIEKEYADLFKQHQGLKMTVTVEAVRMLGNDIAVERGVARVTPPGAAESAARYIVVHAKRDGKWTMVLGRDAPYLPASNQEYLKDIGWLVGEWTTESKSGGAKASFEWTPGKNFIRGTFTKAAETGAEESSTQVIGWNPRLGRIVSWNFAQRGGFGSGSWSKDGDKWIIHAESVLPDGSVGSAVNMLTPIDNNSFTWQSVRRSLDGVPLPETAAVKMVRVKAEK